MLLPLLIQAAAPVASAAPPPTFSILYRPCPAVAGKEVVVCARDSTESNRLPLPDDAPPTPNYVKPDSGDHRDNDGKGGTSCAARMEGCLVGFGPPIMPLVIAAAHAIENRAKDRRWSRARAVDGDRRQPIDLGDVPGAPAR